MRYLRQNAGDRPASQQTIKEENIKRLFNLINREGVLSRASLVRRTHLSPTTVSALVDELVREGFVLETGAAKTTKSGRRPINLRVNAGGRQIAVLSLNRWGVRYTLFDLAYQVLETAFVAHESDRYGGFAEGAQADPDASGDYAGLILDTLTRRAKLFDAARAVGVLLSFPGIYVESEAALSLSAMRVVIRADALLKVENELGAALFIGNSSASMAYAEKKHLDRSGAEALNLIYVNVASGGVGAGIVVNGDIFTGASNTAGEIGHVSIDYRGKPCACGSRGCLERYVSDDAILRRVRGAAAEKQCAKLLDMARDRSDNVTLAMAGELYESGEPAIREVLDGVAEELLCGIYSMVSVTGIKRIVLGGGIERLGGAFLEKMTALARGGGLLMRGAVISYAGSGFRGDSLGIAEYFVDKAMRILPRHARGGE
ncbi:MAG: ROK family transcriptional regulator [Clostridiales bacterium]|nr:ROK family transcriptional regulator [Clostridiales bacterium]